MQTDRELLDLRTIPIADLKLLIEFFAENKGNRFFEDCFIILSRIALAQHECSEMAEYSDHDLADAMAMFIEILSRNPLPDDHPTKMFLRFNLSAACGELERRKRKTILKAVR